MQIQLRGRARIKVWRSCTAEHDPLRRVPRNWLQRNRMAETVVEEAARKDLFADGAEKNVARGSARRVRVDEVAAAAWFRKAAEAGDMGGMVNLAQMYEEGRGGLKNDANQALTWYRSAANIGSPLAQRRVQCADVSDETCASPNSHPHKKTI